MATDGKHTGARSALIALIVIAVIVMAWLAMPAASSGRIQAGAATPGAQVAPLPQADDSPERHIVPRGYEVTVPLSPTRNPAVAGVAQSLKTGAQAEQATPLMAAPPFDPVAYAKDPQSYCNQSVPSRVFQSAAPADAVPTLAPQGITAPGIRVGGSCELVAVSAPHAPVTFTTFDLGEFSNGLTSITVPADAAGLAKAVYTASPGTIGAVNILAASPLASGQVSYRVSIYGNDVAQGMKP